MRIDKLSLLNFRCFEKFEISFGQKITILIGKNGTGKSNLISALVYSLSFPFATIKDKQTIATSSPDLKVASIDSKGINDARYDEILNDYIYPIEITSIAFLEAEKINWSMLKENKGGGLKSTKYREASDKFHSLYVQNSPNNRLPVLAFFSDAYPHRKIDIRTYPKSQLKKDGKLPTNFGYYMWDKETNCIDIWIERYVKVYSSINNFRSREFEIISKQNELYKKIGDNPSQKDEVKIWKTDIETLRGELEEFKSNQKYDIDFREISFIDEKVKKFSSPLREDLNFINADFQVNEIKVIGTSLIGIRLQFYFNDGRKIFFDNLPQGYKRVFSIVFDIAYRSYILNPDLEPTGIVLIDELELHLHPSLQQEVLERLSHTFPEVQFIVSTHSPLIISNLKSDGVQNKIIKLENAGNVFSNSEVKNIYGIDYITSLVEIMGAEYRPSDIDRLMDSYVILKSRGKEDAASKIWEELFSIVGSANTKIREEIDLKLKANS